MSDVNDPNEPEMFDDDLVDLSDFPPDEPIGLPELLGRDVGRTGEYAPDTVEERSGREEPDVVVPDDPTVLRGGLLDDAPDGVGDLASELAEADLEDRSVLSDGFGLRPDDPSPEAAAMHLVEDDDDDDEDEDDDDEDDDDEDHG